jgi:regulator of protease activity HflC (stomatin/prohibitin superfamily)
MDNQKVIRTEGAVTEKNLDAPIKGMSFLVWNSIAVTAAIVVFCLEMQRGIFGLGDLLLAIVTAVYGFVVGPILYAGLRVVKPNEALVLTLFGKYYGTLKKEGFYFVNPFAIAFNPAAGTKPSTGDATESIIAGVASRKNASMATRKISLKAMTLNNQKQKVNDSLGNPVVIGVVVIWKVVDTAKAVFNVDNYIEFLSIQCDSALRNVVRMFPYDASDEEGEKSLRGSSQEVADDLARELQKKVEVAGLKIEEARITHLSYAPEIAAAMLQRQQASAIIAARQKIVEGAVGMVEMALQKLSENKIVELDDERKAAMVSNLLVVLCGNKDAQPVVNSGSIY